MSNGNLLLVGADKFSAIVEMDDAYYLIGERASFSATGDADMYVVKRAK